MTPLIKQDIFKITKQTRITLCVALHQTLIYWFQSYQSSVRFLRDKLDQCAGIMYLLAAIHDCGSKQLAQPPPFLPGFASLTFTSNWPKLMMSYQHVEDFSGLCETGKKSLRHHWQKCVELERD